MVWVLIIKWIKSVIPFVKMQVNGVSIFGIVNILEGIKYKNTNNKYNYPSWQRFLNIRVIISFRDQINHNPCAHVALQQMCMHHPMFSFHNYVKTNQFYATSVVLLTISEGHLLLLDKTHQRHCCVYCSFEYYLRSSKLRDLWMTVPAAKVMTPKFLRLLYPNLSSVRLEFCASTIFSKRSSDGCNLHWDRSILCNNLLSNASKGGCSKILKRDWLCKLHVNSDCCVPLILKLRIVHVFIN